MRHDSDPSDAETDDGTTSLPPAFDRFVIETEQMADGRLIHYYRWPDEPTAPDAADV